MTWAIGSLPAMLKTREIERLTGKPRLKVWLIGLCSAILLTFSQPPAAVPLLGLVALAPMLIALPRLSRGGAWLMGFLVGLPYFWINNWWLGQMVTDPGNEWIVFGMFVFVATAMAVYYGFAAWQMRWLLTRRASWPWLLVPLVWLGWEFIHEFYTPVPYPGLALGVSLADFTLFAQTADVWGQYGLSLTCAAVALALAAPFALEGSAARFVIRPDKLRRYVVPGAALLWLTLGSIYGAVRISQVESREAGDGPKIALVQGNLAQEVKVRESGASDRLAVSYARHVELSREGVAQGAELVCWAETMLFGGATRDGMFFRRPEIAADYFHDGLPKASLLGSGWYAGNLRARIYHEFETPMLVGTITSIPEAEQIHEWKDYSNRTYNTALMFDGQGHAVASYDKRYLVPGGEYIPLEGFGPVRKLIEHYSEGLQGYASRVEPGMRLTTFQLPAEAERLDGRAWNFTSTICYEFAWPGCYIELHTTRERYPDFHVNISNEGWFKESAELDQAVDMMKIRAIESRVPVLRATNTGITCSIDAAGRVRQVLQVDGSDRDVSGVLVVQPAVLTEPVPTLFVALVKRALGWLSLLAILGVAATMGLLHGKAALRRRRIARAKAVEQSGTEP